MALVKSSLKASIKQVFNEVKAYDGSNGKSQDDAIEALTDKLATAIDAYIKSATITSTPVLVAPPGGGPVTGTITNTIS